MTSPSMPPDPLPAEASAGAAQTVASTLRRNALRDSVASAVRHALLHATRVEGSSAERRVVPSLSRTTRRPLTERTSANAQLVPNRCRPNVAGWDPVITAASNASRLAIGICVGPTLQPLASREGEPTLKSTTGAHFLGLDHIRGLAAFMVIAWHFIHGPWGYPVHFSAVPLVFPLVLFDEGHVGVALFMTLSGYLFAKLLDGKQINFGAFLWNRCLRLLPLLLLVIVVAGALAYRSGQFPAYLNNVARGWYAPTLPNGGWSITTEFHFYLVLPLLLAFSRWSRYAPLAFVALGIATRCVIYLSGQPVEPLAYWTIIGRIDQFALGVVAFNLSHLMTRKHVLAAVIFTAFCAIYTAFDIAGGKYLPVYPSKSELWIILPTIEGVCFGALIAWYDRSFDWRDSRVAALLGKPGDYSYSIYLLHFFFVFRAATFIDQHVMSLSNFYVALAWAAIFYAAMVPIGYLSYRFIEAPFLRARRRYVVAPSDRAEGSVTQNKKDAQVNP